MKILRHSAVRPGELARRRHQKIGFRADECIAIEDTPRGLTAATGAGIKCAVIPSTLIAGGDFSAAFKVMRNIRELPALLGH